MRKIILIPLFLILLSSIVLAEEQIAFDGYESGTFTGGTGFTTDWINTGSVAIIGWTNPYEGNRHAWIRSSNAQSYREVNINGYSNIQVSVAIKVNSFEGSDSATLSYLNGGSEILLRTWTATDSDNTWKIYNFTLSSLNSNEPLRIIFKGLMSDLGDEFHIDNVRVTGTQGSLQEVSIVMEKNYVKGNTIPIYMSSSESETLHTFIIRDSSNIYCQTNIISPVIPNTLFETSCSLPDTQIIDAEAYLYVTNSPTINNSHFFNILTLSGDETKLKIEQVYFSPRVLQGGSTEIFTVIKKSIDVNVSKLYVIVTFPDGMQRRLSMEPTINNGEYRAFITDTYRTGDTNFSIFVESDLYHTTYSNQYFVVPFSVDYVANVGSVNKVLEPRMEVHGTEYMPGDNAKIWLQLLNEYGVAVNDAICEVDIYKPTGGLFIDAGSMISMNSDGIYTYDFVAPNVNGVYPAIAKCYFSGVKTIETADVFSLSIGSQVGTYVNTHVLDDVYHTITEGNVGAGQRRLNVTYTFNNMCGRNIPESLLTGVTFTINAKWDSVINDNIMLHYYNYQNNSWVTLPNKIISPNLGTTVTNSISLNNVTTFGIVSSTGESQIRITDTEISDTGASNLYLDYLSIACNQYSSAIWQETKGSSEAHISSRESGDLGYYVRFIDYGELRNNSYMDGFDLYYTVGSQTATTQPNVQVSLPLFYPFPASHTKAVQIFNGTDWVNTTFTSKIGTDGRDNIIVTLDIKPETNYEIRLINDNYWKQHIYSEADNIYLLHDMIDMVCWNYVYANNLTHYVVPNGDSHNYVDDKFYTICDRFLSNYYHYDIEFQTFHNLNYVSMNFTREQMFDLEVKYRHTTDVGHELKNHGETILQGLSTASGYSLAILLDPYPPENPYYAKYFANMSSTNIIYNQNNYIRQNLSDRMDFILNTLLPYIDSIPQDVWEHTIRNLTYYQDVTDYNRIESSFNMINSSINNIPTNVWSYNNRKLTYYPDMTNYSLIPIGVWSFMDRNLTYYPVVSTLTAEDVWTYSNRNLTYFPQQVDMTNYTYIWDYPGRNLTYYPEVSNLTAEDVWSYNNRVLTYYEVNDISPEDVWTYINRTLTYYDVNNISTSDIWTYVNRTLTFYPEVSNLTAEDVWGYTTRNLTYYQNFTEPQIDMTNYNLINEGVWTYSNRNLTYFPQQVDLTNYSAIYQGVWNYVIRDLTYYQNFTEPQIDMTNYNLINEGVWTYSNRNLTYYAPAYVNNQEIADYVWNNTDRNLTYFPQQVDLTNYSLISNLTAEDVWSYSNRVLTYYEVNDISPEDVWTFINRTLTYYEVNNISTMDIWTYNDRVLTFYPEQVDLTNYSAIWDQPYRNLTYYAPAFVDNQEIADYVWNNPDRYTHGVIIN